MAPARAAKRPKLEPSASASTSAAQHQHERGNDDYMPGNIVEIELCNFMTYDRLVCRPGPRLNLVVGPNGSGKSSHVCAIALALAAGPCILGRASSVGAFVKRGEESDHVHLSLRSQGEVYGPVLLEVNVHSKTHAGYLESHVPNYIWRSFITQNASDRDLLVRQLKEYGTPILNYTGGNSIMCEPLNITPEMKQLGITSRLDQEFEAPPVVENVLITQALVDQSYIGTNQVDKSADDVVKLGINDLWTPCNHYRWSRSRYGGHLSANVDSIYPSRLFMCDVNVSDIEMLRSEKDQHAKNVEGMEEALKEL
ncbi:hypothetical protein ZWY2020_002507 [Hordeum vulgare]|nr:hypothetical protein ZWY2020_002507 [Hordeum vulgare]